MLPWIIVCFVALIGFWFTSYFEADHFRSLAYRVPIDVVGSGIEDRADGNAERFRQQTGIAGQMILYIGRKDPDKGYPLVIEKFSSPAFENARCQSRLYRPAWNGEHDGELKSVYSDLGFVSE